MAAEPGSVFGSNTVLIRDAVGRAVSWLGYKRGIHAAAAALDVGERVAKAAHHGEAFAATNDRAQRALEFRRDLAKQRAETLRAELAECEKIAGETTWVISECW